jgi:hypothetical protein
MRVSYKWTFRGWLEGYRAGMSALTLPYRLVWGGILLLVLGGLALMEIERGYPSTWPPTSLPPRTIVLHLAAFVGICLASSVAEALVLSYFIHSRVIYFLPRQLQGKNIWWSFRIRWKDVTGIVETSDYICFCQKAPNAFVVPKSAFPNQEQVFDFIEQAENYWRHETGRNDVPSAENTGVWPPAPRVDNSQEKA